MSLFSELSGAVMRTPGWPQGLQITSNVVGRGAFGIVYRTSQPGIIVKIAKSSEANSNRESSIMNSVNFRHKMFKADITVTPILRRNQMFNRNQNGTRVKLQAILMEDFCTPGVVCGTVYEFLRDPRILYQQKLKMIAVVQNEIGKLQKKGIIHGDLHYGNILYRIINGRIQVSIIDYGFAIIGKEGPEFSTTTNRNRYTGAPVVRIGEKRIRSNKYYKDVYPRRILGIPNTVEGRQQFARNLAPHKWLSLMRNRQYSSPRKLNQPKFKTLTYTAFDINRNPRQVTVEIPYFIKRTPGVEKIDPDFLPQQSWINEQVDYIRNLSDYDFRTAKAYATRSHAWILPWMRTHRISSMDLNSVMDAVSMSNYNRHIAPLFDQAIKLITESSLSPEQWEQEFIRSRFSYDWYKRSFIRMPRDLLKNCLIQYEKDFSRIIQNAPKLPQKMVVYRGVNDLYNNFSLKTFTSTAYVPRGEYIGGSTTPRYLKFSLLKGTKVLLLQPLNLWTSFNRGNRVGSYGEFEVVMDKGMSIKYYKKNVQKRIVNNFKGTKRLARVSNILVYGKEPKINSSKLFSMINNISSRNATHQEFYQKYNFFFKGFTNESKRLIVNAIKQGNIKNDIVNNWRSANIQNKVNSGTARQRFMARIRNLNMVKSNNTNFSFLNRPLAVNEPT